MIHLNDMARYNKENLSIFSVKISDVCTGIWIRYFHINNCPTRCNTKQSIYFSASSLYMFRVSNTPIIRSTQNVNYSRRYWSYFLCSYVPPTWPRLTTSEGYVEWTCSIINKLFCVVSRWTIINIDQRMHGTINTKFRYFQIQRLLFTRLKRSVLFC